MVEGGTPTILFMIPQETFSDTPGVVLPRPSKFFAVPRRKIFYGPLFLPFSLLPAIMASSSSLSPTLKPAIIASSSSLSPTLKPGAPAPILNQGASLSPSLNPKAAIITHLSEAIEGKGGATGELREEEKIDETTRHVLQFLTTKFTGGELLGLGPAIPDASASNNLVEGRASAVSNNRMSSREQQFRTSHATKSVGKLFEGDSSTSEDEKRLWKGRSPRAKKAAGWAAGAK